MSPTPASSFHTERELLRLALTHGARSVWLLFAAVAAVVLVGWHAGAQVAAAVTGILGLTSTVVSLHVARRVLRRAQTSPEELVNDVRRVEVTAALAGLAWVVASVAIYPRLDGSMASVHAVIVVGSLVISGTFFGLVGRAFLILAGLQLGALAAVSAVGSTHRSLPMAMLVAVFGLALYRAMQDFREATERSLRHGQEIDDANDALKRALESAEAANLAKSQFLATMSHEIRTPMNGVLGALDLLRRTPLAPQQRRLVRTAASSGETLLGILNDVLDHSKIEAGKLDLTRASLSLGQVAQSVVALFRSSAEGKGVALILEVAPDLHDRVFGDAQRLKQVLLNLVGNAVKFTERGTVTLAVQAVPTQRPDRLGVQFMVRDTGIGMPADELQSIFLPFHQVGGARHRRRGGTGLGLAISQRIVEAMGGRIEVRSVHGEGSSFAFVVAFEPDIAVAPAPTEDTQPTPLDEGRPLAGTVLVVEDNAVNRMIASEMLRNMGLQVVEAEDGQQALDRLARQDVDLVLMDVQMPVMDGYEATMRIRSGEKASGKGPVPIVAVTANAFGEDAWLAREAGMDAHLAKPFTQAELRTTIARLI